MFCLLSFLTFGVMNDCTEIDTATRSTISMTLLLSAVAFKVSVSAFLPQVPYFTFLDTFMWMLISFISLLAIEKIAWSAASCTNLHMKLGHEDELYVMYGLLFLLVSMVGVMSFKAWGILSSNKKKVKDTDAPPLKVKAPSQGPLLAMGRPAAKVHDIKN